MDHETFIVHLWDRGDINDIMAVFRAAVGVFCCFWNDGRRVCFFYERLSSSYIVTATEISRNWLFPFVLIKYASSWGPFWR